ncbi:cobalt transporter CbiM [Ferrimonas sediminicola]|uniref:Cobalt transporter CbiM n=1 Tax=Ferrimonas sediminicola TaxID=2569538 RepID=A0A4U1BCB1_9GAMM|nr:cobalt transporter CbiM [Ferrimonas sediminicola]TKB48617.1 cobalt transporter CbiM [Ferrimonas sediminicola]
MAHIPDGVLALPVLATSGVAAATLTLVAVKRMDYDRIPQAAVLAAAFFVASLVTVPVGPSSVHLILNGLMGVLLGWAAVPALLVALCMQAVFFGYGGLSVLGVNALNLALPALLCAWVIAPRLRTARGRAVLLWGAVAGAIGVGLTGVMVMLSLVASGPEYLPAGRVILVTYLPLLLVEAVVTAWALSFMKRVAPELLARGEC